MKYIKNIQETLNNPLNIKWVKTETDWIGSFLTTKNEYNIVISKINYDIWKYKFFIKNNNMLSVELTDYNYDSWKVLSTINKSIYDFVEEVKPNGIIFGANNDSKSRVKLYSKFSNDLSVKFGYKKYEFSFGENKINPTVYLIYKILNDEQIFEVIKRITDDEIL